MPEEIRTLALRLQGEQYTRAMRRARIETNRMSAAGRNLSRNMRRQSAAARAQRGSLSDLTASAGKLAAALGIVAGTRAFVRFSKESIKAAADAEETANKFVTVFSSVDAAAKKTADNYAKSFDIASSTAKKLLSDTGDILVGFGFTEDAALDLSSKVNTLAGDLASFTNIEGGTSRASEALTKALVGETEQAKALGIVIRQGTKEYQERVARIQKAENATLLQAKALANLEIAISQTQKAQGDYNKTQDSTSNLMKANAEAGKEFTENFGGALKAILPIDAVVRGTTEALQGMAIPLRDIKNFLTDIESLDTDSPLALLLPNLDARDAGNAALAESQRIMTERRKARTREAKEIEMLARARKRIRQLGGSDVVDGNLSRMEQGRVLVDRIKRLKEVDTIIKLANKEEQAAAKERTKREREARREMDAEKRRTEPLRDLKQQLRLQELINRGKEKEAFIQQELLRASNGRVLSAKELAEVTTLSGKLFDAMNKKEKPEAVSRASRQLRLAGAALEGSADAARTIVGAGSTVDEKIEKNTKKSADNSEAMRRHLAKISRNEAQPANFRRGRR